MNFPYRQLLAAIALPLLAFALPARSAEVHDARLTLDPPQPFVNQTFSLNLDIVVTPGSELQEIRLGGLPGEAQFTLGELVSQPAVRSTLNGQSVAIHRFRSDGRAATPIDLTVQPTVQFNLIERRSRGFFSNWSSFEQRLRLPSISFRIRPLPEAGRPADFSGAVGEFALMGALSPKRVMPMDIVTLTLELSGRGHLGEARPSPPSLDPAQFKVYPATGKPGSTPDSVTLTQSIIPLSTQAVEVAAAHFNYFDPGTETYRTLAAGPFQLIFAPRPPDDIPAVRQVTVEAATRSAESPATVPDLSLLRRREFRALLPLTAGLLAGLGVIAIVRPTHKRLAFVLGLVIFAVVTLAVYGFLSREHAAPHPLTQTVRLRIAPGERARHSVELPAGTQVEILESSGTGWLRIEARNRRGWIPATALRKETPEPHAGN